MFRAYEQSVERFAAKFSNAPTWFHDPSKPDAVATTKRLLMSKNIAGTKQIDRSWAWKRYMAMQCEIRNRFNAAAVE
jgi:hypothetical protein